MRKSLSCTRDLLLAFPRFRHPSVSPVTPPGLSSKSRCSCHTVTIQPSGTRSSPRQAARPHIAQESSATGITQPTSWSENAERVSPKVQPQQMLAGASSVQKRHAAIFADHELRSIETRGPRGYAETDAQIARSSELNGHSIGTIPSESFRLVKAADHISTRNEEIKPHDLDCDQSSPRSHTAVRKPISHLLRRHPQIKQALRERRFRWAVSEILRHPELRRKEALLSQVRKAMWEHANGGRLCSGDFTRLKIEPGKTRTLKDFGLTDLAARLGMPPAGYQRGPHWEQVHRTEVWKRGRLPSELEVLQALQMDINLGLMPRVVAGARAPQSPQNGPALAFDPERERQEINKKLSAFVRSGAISAANRTRPGRVQVSRLFAIIDRYRQRGFRPDRVTANIAVKCWLRSLQARQKDGSRLRDSDGYNRQDAERILGHVINDESLERYISSSNSTDDVERWNDSSSTPDPQPIHRTTLLYDRHVKPLGRLLIKTSRARGDWQAAKRILRWLAIFKARSRGDEGDHH